MTTEASSFPEWIRRRLFGATSSETAAGATTGGHADLEPVVVWEAANTMEAEIVRGRLESEGIPAIIRSESLGQIYGLTMGGLARADVLVPAPLADKAIELLSVEVDEVEGGAESEGEANHSAGE